MKIENELTRLLGIKYPIIQGAFGPGGMGTSQIAVPVSEAGGLGILTTTTYPTPDAFKADLQKAQKITDKPLAVNFSCMPGSQFDYQFHREHIKIALDEGVKIAFTSGYEGSPIGLQFKEAGRIWIHKCAAIRHAVSASQKGVDAIVIVGLEGSGYKSPEQNTTLINITAGRKLIHVPLIAAGGIGDGYGFVSALAMGATGIYMGTGFMATKEFKVSDKFKQGIINQEVTDSSYIQKIYHMDHGSWHSLASGVIGTIPTVKEYIDKIMAEAEEIISRFKQWKMI